MCAVELQPEGLSFHASTLFFENPLEFACLNLDQLVRLRQSIESWTCQEYSFIEAEAIDGRRSELLKFIAELLQCRQQQTTNLYAKVISLLEVLLRYNSLASDCLSAKKSSRIGWGAPMGWAKAKSQDLEEIIELAHLDPFNFDLAIDLCSAVINGTAAGRDASHLTPKISRFATDVLQGKIKRPTIKGPHPLRNWGRDKLIVELIEVCVSNGLAPYRNEATELEESACDALAEICHIKRAGVSTYEAIRKIWAHRPKRGEELGGYLAP